MSLIQNMTDPAELNRRQRRICEFLVREERILIPRKGVWWISRSRRHLRPSTFEALRNTGMLELCHGRLGAKRYHRPSGLCRRLVAMGWNDEPVDPLGPVRRSKPEDWHYAIDH